jgi:hypothetical protein
MLRVHEVTEQLLDRQTFNDFFDPEIFLSSLLTKSIFPGTLFPDHVAEFPDTESRPSRSTYWQSSSAAHRKKISITDVYLAVRSDRWRKASFQGFLVICP